MRVYSGRTATALALLSSLTSTALGDSPRPCTAKSSTTGSFFDLSPISRQPPGKTSSKDARTESWHANGYDYGANFTLNFCAPVVEELDDVDGIREDDWENVAAYYEEDGQVYSIG